MTVLDPSLYTVAWIAPLEIEARAALCLFDEIHEGDFPLARGTDYVFDAGIVCGHHVVLATLPPGQPYGTGSAGALAGQVKMFFPNLWFGLLVGVAAGLPDHSRSPPQDIRLGDVLVALPSGDSAGLVAYDLGKEVGEAGIQLLDGGHGLAKTETVIRSAIGKIKRKSPKDTDLFLPYYQGMKDAEPPLGTFIDPGQDKDVLYDGEETVARSSRLEPKRTRVWYGPIGSGDKLMRDAAKRDTLRDKYGIIGLEMEAAGTMNTIPAGVIRGVCAYGDHHNNKDWQPYASAMAAAYAKGLLHTILPKKIRECHFLVPLDRNLSFVGRVSILTQLLARVPPASSPDTCQYTVIEGLDGIGKTQLALEIAYQVRDTCPDCSIFWVPAINRMSFEQAYQGIGQKLNVQGVDEKGADVKLLVKAALDREEGSWLVIIDNADDSQLLFEEGGLFEYLPSNRRGSILFTTRNHETAIKLDVPLDGVLSVAEMSRHEATKLLQQYLKENQMQDPASTSDLLDILMDLPLAIRQAAAYMAQTRISASQYVQHCQSSEARLIKLLSKDFNDRGRYKTSLNPIATTWLVSFRQISRDKKLAAEYLGFVSFLSEREIPKDILPPADDELDMEEAIGTLKAYTFIVERASGDSYDMHRLVGLAMRNWIAGKTDVEVNIMDVLQRLGKIYPDPPEHENKGLWLCYLPHARRALSFRSQRGYRDAPSVAHLMTLVARSDDNLGNYKGAEPMYREALDLRKKILGLQDPATLNSLNNFASILDIQGKCQEAEEIHRQTLDARMKILGPQHPSTLTSMNNLASTLECQGKYKEAAEIIRKTVQVCTDVFGPEHPDTLSSTNNLAIILNGLGEYEEAEDLFRKTLDLRIKVLGPEHSGTLTSLNNFGIVLNSMKKYDPAEDVFKQAVGLCKTIFGPRHPNTLSSMSNHAAIMNKQGKDVQAEPIHRETLELRKETLGPRHPHTLISMHSLATTLHNQERYFHAEEMHTQAFDLRKDILGPQHPHTLASMDGLGSALRGQEKYDEAERVLRSTLDLRSESLGPQHPSTLISVDSLASVLESQGKDTEAKELLSRLTITN
ncbi:unnamed protein product [Clonostachys solani]|uniref:NB-ARC domain-containing protein n=1 Tax=Clonostachys solani TaxID=160281 RepID=A0A9N9ZM81_9HYPO|nr:unnamed protein product [Clonostachys solani]